MSYEKVVEYVVEDLAPCVGRKTVELVGAVSIPIMAMAVLTIASGWAWYQQWRSLLTRP